MRPVIFLDRDGVINQKAPPDQYIHSWNSFTFLPGAIEGLARLSSADGPALVIVTNQRGIARGHMSLSDVADIHGRMLLALAAEGAEISAVYTCPHEIGTCSCRKPEIGLFSEAVRRDPTLDLTRAAVVGDSMSDLLAGQRLGVPTYLVADVPDPILAAAAIAGVHVSAHAPSLLDLVERGAFDALRPVAS